MNEILDNNSKSHISCAHQLINDYSNAIKQITLPQCYSEIVEELKNLRGNVIVTGLGKSGIIARKMSSSLSSIGVASQFLHASEAGHGDIGSISKDDAVIALSHSGESYECSQVVKFAKKLGIITVAITRSMDSSLAKDCNYQLCYPFDTESGPHGLAPTTSTAIMLTLSDCLVVSLASLTGMTPHVFANNHPAGSLGLKLTPVSSIMKSRSQCAVVTPTCTLKNVLTKITQQNVGIAMIVENQLLAAVFTDGDLRRALSKGISLNDPIIEYATTEPKCISSTTAVQDALNTMHKHSITSLPVVESGVLIGSVDIHQIKGAKE